MQPVVSIVIPVYNTEKYLTECLESVCGQTLRDIQIICVDDGSTDRSAAILRAFAEKDERIRVITQPNGGELAARSTGIRAAAGKWIGFVDSDDKIMPDMFEHLLANGEKYRADISHCGLSFFYEDGHEVPHYGTGLIKAQDHDTGLADLLDGSRIEPSMCCKLYRKELFDNFSVEARIRNNGDLYCNFLLFSKAKSAVYEDFCGYRYRRNPGSASGNFDSVNVLRRVLSVRRDILEMSPAGIRESAYHLWLSTLVNTLNRIRPGDGPEAAAFYEDCRSSLRAEENNLGILSRKQQAAAKLHLKTPHLARLIYRIYGKYSLYRYEH